MTLRWLLAGLHLLALGVGLGAVWVRGRSLLSRLDERGLHAVFLADMWWGIAAFIWIGTGLWRLLAGLEKDTGYYLHNHLFLTKMGLLGVILVLEVWPMMTLIKWRRQVRAGGLPVTGIAPALARISFAQVVLVLVMVFLASAMARGYGVPADLHPSR
jgi:putative membrane protein